MTIIQLSMKTKLNKQGGNHMKKIYISPSDQAKTNYADGSDAMDARIAESNAWSAGLQKFSGGGLIFI